MFVRLIRLGKEDRIMDVAIPEVYRGIDPYRLKEYVSARWPGWKFLFILPD